ncbi:MAG: ATP-binding protein [archaeon GB-1867-035]|nr:ATP-binding protein [Candidatus Culexmicrobium profundum]
MTFFDPKPKVKKEDLYNREEELEKLKFALKTSPLILILGLRRTGKTSLLYTALNEFKIPNIIVDLRALPQDKVLSLSEFTSILRQQINNFLLKRRKIAKHFLKLVEHVEGIRVMGLSISFKKSRREKINLAGLFEALNEAAEREGIRMVVAFDEAQELRRIAAYRLDRLLAYIYDRLRNITLILTGSQIGLLYNFIGVNNPASPLYGRARSEIRLKNFTHEQSKEFLIKGFKQYNMHPPDSFIEYAINKLNGVVGWLTLLGYKAATQRRVDKSLVDEMIEEAEKLALNEFNHFLNLRWQAKRRYILIMKTIARLEKAAWTQIKTSLEISINKKVDDKNFTTLLKNLVNSGFIHKNQMGEYEISDPILKYALK